MVYTGNHSPHGQAASIWTEDLTLALETAKKYTQSHIYHLLANLCFPLSYIVIISLSLLLLTFSSSLVFPLARCGLIATPCLTPACLCVARRTVETALMEDRRWVSVTWTPEPNKMYYCRL